MTDIWFCHNLSYLTHVYKSNASQISTRTSGSLLAVHGTIFFFILSIRQNAPPTPFAKMTEKCGPGLYPLAMCFSLVFFCLSSS